MSRRDSVLVLGCGSIGRRHLRNLARIGGLDLLVYDPAPTQPSADLPEARWLPSLPAALDADPSMVVIGAPPGEHLELLRSVLRTRAAVLVEKPLAVSSDGLEEVLAAAQNSGRLFRVAYNWRFHPSLLCVRRWMLEHRIGDLLGMQAEFGQYLPAWRPQQRYQDNYICRAEGGGILWDASHELDLMLWLGGAPKAVSCIATRCSALEMEAEDTALLMIRMAGAAVADLRLDCVQRGYTRHGKLIGSEGTLAWDSKIGAQWTDGTGSVREQRAAQPDDVDAMYLAEMQDFVSAAQGRQASAGASLAEGAAVVRLVEAARRASRERREVAL